MAALGKKEWSGILFGLGGGAVLRLVAASDLPSWSIFVLASVAGLSYTVAAYLLKAFGEPKLPRGFVILSLIWIPLIVLVKRELPSPSFPYVEPGVVLNPNRPDTFWVFFVVTRGHSELYNVDMFFQDMIRTEAVTKALTTQTLPTDQVSKLIQSESVHLHYGELDHNTSGGNNRQVAQFYWRPPTMTNEQYDILSTHRKGTVREQLYIKQIGTEWQYAMRVVDEGSHELLIECRDPHFPVDKDWKQELPKCFPNY